jgi:hypothetical protein
MLTSVAPPIQQRVTSHGQKSKSEHRSTDRCAVLPSYCFSLQCSRGGTAGCGGPMYARLLSARCGCCCWYPCCWRRSWRLHLSTIRNDKLRQHLRHWPVGVADSQVVCVVPRLAQQLLAKVAAWLSALSLDSVHDLDPIHDLPPMPRQQQQQQAVAAGDSSSRRTSSSSSSSSSS